ncbi:MAG: hypothetical protein A2X86_10945 [Bdellovibrionales bacterium GWA2_49_15]|nr:MAG: hypothetical protein A2X86_10945 [Bdellovibrionales bacterium GWA2_49_15]HAZ11493.1 hypothetical protein [Bdellovibrionales bacterium]
MLQRSLGAGAVECYSRLHMQCLSEDAHFTYRFDDTLSVDTTPRGRRKGLATRAGTFYFLKDSLGTITDIADEAGPLVQHYVYSSFGKSLTIKDQNGNDVRK